MKYSFIVLETKMIDNVIHVYGGLVPIDSELGVRGSLAEFQWFKLSWSENNVSNLEDQR